MQWCVLASSQYKLHAQSRPLSCSLEVTARASRSAVRCRLTAQGFACISHDCVKCRVSNVNIFTRPWVWRIGLLSADLGSPRLVLPYQHHVLASTGARPHRLYVRRSCETSRRCTRAR